MPGQPLLHLGMLVRVVVVADQIDLTTRVGLRDRVEKSDELNVRVAREAAAVDLATRDLEGCEQAGRSVALVVVGHPRREYLAQGQDRLGAVEGLDLGLLVDAQDERSFGRIQVQAHDVGQLGIEVRITAALEGLDPVGVQAVLLPDASSRGKARPPRPGAVHSHGWRSSGHAASPQPQRAPWLR